MTSLFPGLVESKNYCHNPGGLGTSTTVQRSSFPTYLIRCSLLAMPAQGRNISSSLRKNLTLKMINNPHYSAQNTLIPFWLQPIVDTFTQLDHSKVQGNFGVERKNLTDSWKDGMGLCALIHHYHPKLIED
ncbi:hypothetical protein EMCRGX_G010846 [Ephydatia muelleri]